VSDALRAIVDRYRVRLDQPGPIRLPAGRADLPKLCRVLGMTRGAEVGVWKGGYSLEFCKAIPNLEWLAIDPWAPYADYREKKNDATLIAQAYEEARAKLAPYRCTLVKASSLDAAADVPDASLDVVYVDGNHEAPFVRHDLEAWTKKLKPGGLLCGHDYRVPPESKPFIQVKAAVDQYVSDREIAPWFIFAGDKTPSFMWSVT
jgi:hypothetical protein